MYAKKILFPTDFSEASQEALEHAVTLAHDTAAALLIVHVEEPPMPFGEALVTLPDGYDADLKRQLESIVPDAPDLAAARDRVDGPLPATLPVMDYSVYTTHRDPVLQLYKSFALPNAHDPGDHIHGHVTLDPRSGAEIPAQARKLGSEFFYPLHYSLHIEWKELGYWIVGLAALAMLAALVSGVVIHRRLFRELFTSET